MYVIPFPGPGGKVRISEAGGFNSRWRRDGKELFYTVSDRLISVEVQANGSNFVVGRVSSLFAGVPRAPGYSYDVSADGQRFLMMSAPEQSAAEPLTLVQNWTAGLRR